MTSQELTNPAKQNQVFTLSVSSELIFNFLSAILLVTAAWQCVRLQDVTRDTTAETARRWALAALAVALVSCIVGLDSFHVSIRLQSALRYFAAVLLLTPLIAVLGARRPGAAAWPWFVLLPLVVVLQWPSISQLFSGRDTTPIEIPTPTVVGFLLVLVMGAGNFIGTSNTGSILAAASGSCLILAPSTEWLDADQSWAFCAGSLLIMWAGVRVRHSLIRSLPDKSEKCASVRLQALWSTFRDLYGLVWAGRVADRVNQFADREAWDVRLTLDGFVRCTPDTAGNCVPPNDPQGQPLSVPDRPVQVLCWVLRRFLDQPFIRRFLADDLWQRISGAEC